MTYNFEKLKLNGKNIGPENQTYRADNNSSKPKYYVLDMFPYPSGAGLHVGHPLGYIASDIVSQYAQIQGYNVLHPQGYDSFGLPAEQYAIQTGQHPATTTKKILLVIENNSTEWVFHLIGAEKYALQIQIITNGLNGFFFSSLIIIIVKNRIKQSQFSELTAGFEKKEIWR